LAAVGMCAFNTRSELYCGCSTCTMS